MTAAVPMPFGTVGVSFHKRCFVEDEAGAEAIVREAVGLAADFVSSLSSPTPPVIH